MSTQADSRCARCPAFRPTGRPPPVLDLPGVDAAPCLQGGGRSPDQSWAWTAAPRWGLKPHLWWDTNRSREQSGNQVRAPLAAQGSTSCSLGNINRSAQELLQQACTNTHSQRHKHARLGAAEKPTLSSSMPCPTPHIHIHIHTLALTLTLTHPHPAAGNEGTQVVDSCHDERASESA